MFVIVIYYIDGGRRRRQGKEKLPPRRRSGGENPSFSRGKVSGCTFAGKSFLFTAQNSFEGKRGQQQSFNPFPLSAEWEKSEGDSLLRESNKLARGHLTGGEEKEKRPVGEREEEEKREEKHKRKIGSFFRPTKHLLPLSPSPHSISSAATKLSLFHFPCREKVSSSAPHAFPLLHCCLRGRELS